MTIMFHECRMERQIIHTHEWPAPWCYFERHRSTCSEFVVEAARLRQIALKL